MRFALIPALVLSGCSFSGASVGDETDASISGDGQAALDAAVDASVELVWMTPVRITDIEAGGGSAAEYDDPFLTPSGRLYYSYEEGGTEDIRSGLWDGATFNVTQIRDEPGLDIDRESSIWVADDELAIVFTISGNNNREIFESTRALDTDPWSTPTSTSFSTINALDQNPVIGELSQDRLVMVYSVQGDNYDLFVTSRANTNDDFPRGVVVPGLDSNQNENTGRLRESNLAITFTRSSGNGTDLMRAERQADDVAFGDAIPLTEFNTPADESDLWLSDDGLEAFFAREDAAGRKSIYYSKQVPAP